MTYQKESTANLITELMENNFPFPIHNIQAEVINEDKEKREVTFNISWEWSRHDVTFSNVEVIFDVDKIDFEALDKEDIEEYIENKLRKEFD